MPVSDSRETFRFRDFELDVAAYQLRRKGRPVHLERQPMDLLILLVEGRHRLVSRDEIIDRLWGKDVFVDVETGVHTAIRKVREALRDSPDTPAFVETVPGKGYRFIAPVEILPALHSGPKPAASREHQDAPVPTSRAEEAAQDVLTSQERAQPADQTGTTLAVSSSGSEGLAASATAPAASTRVITEAKPVSAYRFTVPTRPRLTVGLLAVALLAGLVTWAWLGAGAPVSRVTLAVLPFENLSGDPEREYLADGLAEETIVSLGQIDPEHVSVIGRTSTMAYKRATKSVAEIGHELSADYLVESSIRAENDRVRITSKLIRVRDQVQVWSASYDREPTSMLGLERELSTAIAEQIRLRLSPERLDALTRRQTRNADAYDLYLRGRDFENQRKPVTTRRAIEYYERAIALDPGYALAWSGLATTYSGSSINGDAPPLEVWPRAREAAVQAVRAGPNLAEAQLSLGHVNWSFDWDWPAAEAAFRRAIVLDPNNATAHRQLGHALSQSGRHSEAQPAMCRARELDPLEPMAHALSSQVAFQARDYSAAVEHARQAIIVDPEFWIGYMQLAQPYEQLGKTELALEVLTNAVRFSGGNSKAISLRGYLLGKVGRANEAREVLRTLEAVSRNRYVPPYAMALVHASLGEREAVFEWLDKAYAARDVHLIFLPVDPKWDPYRADARFEALLARCGFTRTARTQP